MVFFLYSQLKWFNLLNENDKACRKTRVPKDIQVKYFESRRSNEKGVPDYDLMVPQ